MGEPNTNAFEGTATLTVDPKNPHELNRGIWEMEWSGSITPTDDGLLVIAIAEGWGIAGKVKGMKANWTYTMNYTGPMLPGDFPFDITDPSFYYAVTGNIEKPQGPIKKH